jgi:hypothetical protein
MAPGADRPLDEEQSPAGWQHRDTLRLADIAMAILEARPLAPLATAAAVSRERCGDELHVQVSLLSDPAYAAKAGDPGGAGEPGKLVASFAVRRLSPDLTDAFGEKDVIVLK